MPSGSTVCFCAIAATLFWTCLGWPLARRLAPQRLPALAMAPALGWAVFCPPAFLILWLAGFTRATVAALAGMGLLASLAAVISAKTSPPAAADRSGVPWWAYAAAALLAIAPAIAVMPKVVGGGVILAAPIFDHSKVAIIDDIARLGLPPGNPFLGGDGAPSRLAYYYLWHFSAALVAVLLGASGWEADIAVTWFTAFASLALMMGLAVWLGGRRAAALWVPVLSLAASLRPVLAVALGAERLGRLLSPDLELQTWIVQASWAPQHLASATCTILTVLLLSRLAEHGGGLTVAALALVAAAGFESSAWIGGVTVALAAMPVGVGLLMFAAPKRRLSFLVAAIAAALLAVVIALPVIHDEYLATAARASGWPIALHPYPVLGSIIPPSIRRILDLPAYWLLLLAAEFPAIYLAGSRAFARMIASPAAPSPSKQLAFGLGLLGGASLAVGWLLVSTIANNDLGWRGVLPAVLVLTVFAAVELSAWRVAPRTLAAAAIGLFALGLVGGMRFIYANATGDPASSATAFAQSPALWQAVRRHAAPDERVGNDPAAFADMSAWPVNISWALLANRRSCYAGWALAQAFIPLPYAQIDALEALFIRVFAGDGSTEDVHRLATQYRCHVIVVSAQDGAWRHDPFAASADYRLVEASPDQWRIYASGKSAR
jgi:hypothetical protein